MFVQAKNTLTILAVMFFISACYVEPIVDEGLRGQSNNGPAEVKSELVGIKKPTSVNMNESFSLSPYILNPENVKYVTYNINGSSVKIEQEPWAIDMVALESSYNIEVVLTDINGNTDARSTVLIPLIPQFYFDFTGPQSYKAGLSYDLYATIDNYQALNIEKVSFYVDDVLVADAFDGPNYLFNWQAVLGEHEITAKAFINGDDKSTSLLTVNVMEQVETEVPTVNVTFDMGKKVGEIFSITAVPSTTVDLEKIEFFIDDLKIGENTVAPWVKNWTAVEGEHDVKVLATYQDNVTATIVKPVTIGTPSNDAPTSEINSPANNSNVALMESVSIVSSNFDVNGELLSVELFVDRLSVERKDSPQKGELIFNWVPSEIKTYLIEVKVTDLGGLTTTSQVSINAVAANSAPSISFTAPNNNSSHVQGLVAVSYDASDVDHNLVKVQLLVDGMIVSTDDFNAVKEKAGSFVYDFNSAGTKTLSLVATDSEAETFETDLVITINEPSAELVPPTIAINSPANGADINQGNSTVSVSARDVNGDLVNVVLQINGQQVAIQSAMDPSRLDHEFSVNFSALGNTQIKAIATDAEGFTAETIKNITVNEVVVNIPVEPTISITSPANNAQIDQGATDINFSAEDIDSDLVKVELFVNNFLVDEMVFSATGSKNSLFNYNFSSAGQKNIKVVATDSENLTSQSSIAITVKEVVVVEPGVEAWYEQFPQWQLAMSPRANPAENSGFYHFIETPANAAKGTSVSQGEGENTKLSVSSTKGLYGSHFNFDMVANYDHQLDSDAFSNVTLDLSSATSIDIEYLSPYNDSFVILVDEINGLVNASEVILPKSDAQRTVNIELSQFANIDLSKINSIRLRAINSDNFPGQGELTVSKFKINGFESCQVDASCGPLRFSWVSPKSNKRIDPMTNTFVEVTASSIESSISNVDLYVTDNQANNAVHPMTYSAQTNSWGYNLAAGADGNVQDIYVRVLDGLNNELVSNTVTLTTAPKPIAGVTEWQHWSSAGHAFPANGGNAIMQIEVDNSPLGEVGEYVVHIEANANTTPELYVQVNPWMAASDYQTGPGVSLPESSKFMEVEYKSTFEVKIQARENSIMNPLTDCEHGGSHPMATLPSTSGQWVTQKIQWSDFTTTDGYAANANREDKIGILDTTKLCKLNFVMYGAAANSELTIKSMLLEDYHPDDAVPCEISDTCTPIKLNMKSPSSNTSIDPNTDFEIVVETYSKAGDLTEVLLKVFDESDLELSTHVLSESSETNVYKHTLNSGPDGTVQKIQIISSDANYTREGDKIKVSSSLFTPTGVTPWIHWWTKGPLSTPQSETSALTQLNGIDVSHAVSSGAGDMEMTQFFNPYTTAVGYEGASTNIAVFGSEWVQITYQSSLDIELQIREGATLTTCQHGYAQHKTTLLASPDQFSTVRVYFNEFEFLNGTPDDARYGELVDLENVCKFNFYQRTTQAGQFLTIRDLTIDKYHPDVMAPN